MKSILMTPAMFAWIPAANAACTKTNNIPDEPKKKAQSGTGGSTGGTKIGKEKKKWC